MTEINIARHIDKLMIFDDPVYCTRLQRCGFLGMDLSSDFGPYICNLFTGTKLDVDKFGRQKKCPQCKEAWSKSKIENTPIHCKLCDDEIKHNGHHWEHVNTKPRHIGFPENESSGNLLDEEYANPTKDLSRDEYGRPYINPLHPERGTY